MNKKLLILLFLSISLIACNGTSLKKRASSLHETITEYNVSLRWAMLNRLEGFHLGKDGEVKTLDRSAMEKIRVTGYDILDVSYNEDASEAVVKGQVKYYTTDSGTLKTLDFTHTWWYDEEHKQWFNASDYLDLR